jgi:uncharacterized membrane protein YfcA
VRGAGPAGGAGQRLVGRPTLLRGGLGSLRLALPLAVLASASSIAGAMLGLAMPANVVQTLLGVLVLGIVVLMFVSKKSEFPHVATSPTRCRGRWRCTACSWTAPAARPCTGRCTARCRGC